MKVNLEIEIDEIPDCCAVCRFFKQIEWMDKGEIQVQQCLITGRVSE